TQVHGNRNCSYTSVTPGSFNSPHAIQSQLNTTAHVGVGGVKGAIIVSPYKEFVIVQVGRVRDIDHVACVLTTGSQLIQSCNGIAGYTGNIMNVSGVTAR